MSKKKKDADKARVRLKRASETEEQREQRLATAKTWRESKAGKEAKRKEIQRRHAKEKGNAAKVRCLAKDKESMAQTIGTQYRQNLRLVREKRIISM